MSYSTVISTYHIWLCSIATDIVLVEKQEAMKTLQEKIVSLSLQLTQSKENIRNLNVKMNGKINSNH